MIKKLNNGGGRKKERNIYLIKMLCEKSNLLLLFFIILEINENRSPHTHRCKLLSSTVRGKLLMV